MVRQISYFIYYLFFTVKNVTWIFFANNLAEGEGIICNSVSVSKMSWDHSLLSKKNIEKSNNFLTEMINLLLSE